MFVPGSFKIRSKFITNKLQYSTYSTYNVRYKGHQNGNAAETTNLTHTRKRDEPLAQSLDSMSTIETQPHKRGAFII